MFRQRTRQVMRNSEVPEELWDSEWATFAGAGPEEPDRGAARRRATKMFLHSERQRLDRDTWLSRHSQYEQQNNSSMQRFWKLRRAVVLTVVYNARDVETVSPNWPFTSDTVMDHAKNRGLTSDTNSRRAQLVACAVRTADHINASVKDYSLLQLESWTAVAPHQRQNIGVSNYSNSRLSVPQTPLSRP